MKLSEAIRLGAMIRPQGFLSTGVNGGLTCALNAACEAVGIDQRAPSYWRQWPWIKSTLGICPECGNDSQETISYIIAIHLNVNHHWTRERIADWVETIEPAEPVATVPEP